MKIISISHNFSDEKKYKRTLTYKILEVLSNHFVVENYIYMYKNGLYNGKDIVQCVLPLKKGSFFSSFINIIYIYFMNIMIIYKRKSDLIWIGASPGYNTSLLFIYGILFRKKKIFLQLFTPSVEKRRFRRNFANALLKMNLKFFSYIGSEIDENVVTFKIPKHKLIKLGVGYPDYGFSLKSFKNLNLIYLGTINGRELYKTIEGLGMFIKRNKELLANKKINITYDIIGGGSQHEIQIMKNEIARQKLSNIIKYHGYLEEEDVKIILKKTNVGIAYLPKTSYYNSLPSTKIIEYFLSGMPVLSVDTEFARKVINKKSGILCIEGSQGFAIGLEKTLMNLNNFDSKEIRKLYESQSMNKVMEQQYIPQLLRI